MWMPSPPAPDVMRCAIESAFWIGMAYASPALPPENENRGSSREAATSMPTTRPDALASGPPESPGWMPASTWMRPSRVSLEPSVSDATMRWSSAVTRPGAIDGAPPFPPALPSPTTASPTERSAARPIGAVVSPETPWILMSATSAVTLYPRTFAECMLPLAEFSTRSCAVSAITWLLVSTSPSEEMTTPVPAAAPPLERRVVMLTIESSSFAAIRRDALSTEREACGTETSVGRWSTPSSR